MFLLEETSDLRCCLGACQSQFVKEEWNEEWNEEWEGEEQGKTDLRNGKEA